ncbi:Nuclear transport factor 2 (NTF2) family protein [Thalictrum thalictroides]|uniref:Nuclear transport factor 2 (NTF2) family protein n=1 Tax=Thalictrum thalictroides TaxID=46969 RepID=A0A7J6UVV6_THATH|nr:Nuclear transport factor 2 (NTF2) family protein [Thalictrum thalictroides]
MEATDSVHKLKEKIHVAAGLPLNRLSVIFNGNELNDNRLLEEYTIPNLSEIIAVLRPSPSSSSTPQLSNNNGNGNGNGSSAKRLKLMVLPKGGAQKVQVEVNASDNVGELKKELQKLQNQMNFSLPNEGYFFIYKQNVMDDDRTFRWHDVKQGDAFGLHKLNNMSCINNFGTLRFSPSHFSKQHEFRISSLFFMKRRVPFIMKYGKPIPHSQISRKYRQSVFCVKSEDSDANLNAEGTILDEQTLERELQIAVEEENYAQAAKIRDSLRFLQEDSKAAVLAANARFYNCFREGDLAAMRALWAKRDSICCVHPGVSGISGYDYVMGSWDYVCAEYDFPLEIEVRDVELFVKGDVGYVTCTETVKTKGTSNWGKQFATNVFERINGHWFICIHHASFVEL